MSKYILDSSALLALLNSEPGEDKVKKILSQSVMSTVNVAEAIAAIEFNLSISSQKCREIVVTLINEILPFDLELATLTASLKIQTKQYGLSLGDRACIALGIKLNAPVYTADKIWQNLNIPNLRINLIR